ncbi:MAG: ComF family protein [Bacillota bacterium]
MLSRLRHWSQHVLARLPSALPSCCALCGAATGDTICSGCAAQYFSRRRHRCARCAHVLPDVRAQACGDCVRQMPAFDATIAATDYAPPADQLALALKFGSRLELAPALARLLRDAALQVQEGPLPTVLTAVPLGSRRLVERGFNQALEIAHPLSRLLGIRLDARLVARRRETDAQALLHPDARHRNMRQAFVVPSAAIDRVRGAHIGVVDDVMTTGATLNEVAATLKRFGAARVTNFVFARTLPN